MALIEEKPQLDHPEELADRREKDTIVEVLVLPRDGHPPLFYHESAMEEQDEDEEAQGSEPGADNAEHDGGGFRGWLRRMARTGRRAEKKAPEWLQATIRWVKARKPIDEHLMRALRPAEAILLIHPTTIACDDVLVAWDSYLDSRLRRHLLGLLIDSVIALPTIFLAVVPGPNVIGYWFVYRAICNGLALAGVVRARRGWAPTACRDAEILNGAIEGGSEAAERIQRYFGLRGLHARLHRERKAMEKRESANDPTDHEECSR